MKNYAIYDKSDSNKVCGIYTKDQFLARDDDYITRQEGDQFPYIVITDEELSNFKEDSQMYVTDEGLFKEYVQSDSVLLEEANTSKILEIKSEAYSLINANYPDYKQRNILMSGDATNIADMNAAITKIRNRSNEIEAGLKDLTLSEIINFNITF